MVGRDRGREQSWDAWQGRAVVRGVCPLLLGTPGLMQPRLPWGGWGQPCFPLCACLPRRKRGREAPANHLQLLPPLSQPPK